MQNTAKLGACLLAACLSTCVGSSRRAPHPSKEVASLLDLSFAANQAARSPITAALTRLRLALDVERRTTPWDWCRHQQFVVEDTSTGRLLGFAELWAENAAACGAAEAATPQPVVFNLCVAPAARRRGIARRLLSQCESAAQRWGEGGLFLKVEHDNAAALSLYRRLGYDWMAEWKGGRRRLSLLRKEIEPPRASEPEPARPRRFSELQVQTYEAGGADGQAYLWFALLVLRNAGRLSPAYSMVGGGSAVLLGLLTYALLVEWARHS
ncbi:hypothetical protein EMIHUDRAFT_212242 [Emiliania huxleyi CCMP1516]|uniref:N-acetyltransferase domain-containing protein n=2 Tax=Emiliania huxleyi TaxID=2903 RepID=A0A0D3IR78_EMIH1|nr:hypothetical protein EMIHUDRAFT_212242 [Emiliania huxleyi CCMP1516]EOD13763.1 hypothetical protein EMIHUDRAFT_212242 [Emiliania huxleyi CCMP1516]|eukprot:XP_005766192.1 hypothetical protein EMIHUDRAFT_212242 [Emiliania huxleyi CCMP1516]